MTPRHQKGHLPRVMRCTQWLSDFKMQWCLVTHMSSMVAPFCCSRYACRLHAVSDTMGKDFLALIYAMAILIRRRPDTVAVSVLDMSFQSRCRNTMPTG